MAILLQIDNLAKSFGDRMLFNDVTLGISQGDKIGLIAPNGSGKTTFLRILAGEEDYDEGKIVFRNDIRVGFLQQNPEIDGDLSIMEYAIPRMLHDEDYSAEDNTKAMLFQLGITDIERKLKEISGGQMKRVALARTLLEEPDILILDEPTNHLDIKVIEWLENYLSQQKITLLMVTHDRYFLDKVCNKIWEIDREEFYVYAGNYDYYLEKRQERYDALNAELSKVKNLLRTELEWMRRQPQARGGKAKARIDNFYALEEKSHTNLRESQVKLSEVNTYIGSKIFEANKVSKTFGDKIIMKDWDYVFSRFEKVGIVGDNGVGKTTFLKLLLGELAPDSGSFDIGTTVKWGYYSQEGMTGFDEKKKVIDAVREIAEDVRIDENTRISASQFLSRFLFTPDTQQKYIYKLSGGERRRLNLATVLMRNPNFLILDEPTNDLDIVTLSVLEEYLRNFKGCVIIVSHDRFFLDRIVDHLLVFEGNGIISDFPGNYSQYRQKVSDDKKTLSQSSEKDKTKNEGVPKKRREEKVKLSFKEKKEYEELSARLPLLEEEKRELEEKLSSGDINHEELMEASGRIGELMEEIDEVEMRLLELMEKGGE